VTCVVGARLNKQGCRNGKKKKKNITGELLCKRGNNETAEDFKTANKKRAAFKRKNQESYLNHGLITTDDVVSCKLYAVDIHHKEHIVSPFFLICGWSQISHRRGYLSHSQTP